MREPADQNNSEYKHFLCSGQVPNMLHILVLLFFFILWEISLLLSDDHVQDLLVCLQNAT